MLDRFWKAWFKVPMNSSLLLLIHGIGEPGTFHRAFLYRWFKWLVPACLLVISVASPAAVQAQIRTEADKGGPVLIGVLTRAFGNTPMAEGMKQGLIELGYREFTDFVVGTRFTSGDNTIMSRVANELVESGAEILVGIGTAASTALSQATDEHPILFLSVSDPIGASLVNSFARPGRNVTGIVNEETNLDVRRFELLKELVPDMKRVLYPYYEVSAHPERIRRLNKLAQQLGVELILQNLESLDAAQIYFERFDPDLVDGIYMSSAIENNIMGFALEAASKNSIPAVFPASEYAAELGGLASYGSSYFESGRQLARLVQKVINGQRPADIPVEVERFFELVINLQAAQAIGLKVSPKVLFKADKVIR